MQSCWIGFDQAQDLILYRALCCLRVMLVGSFVLVHAPVYQKRRMRENTPHPPCNNRRLVGEYGLERSEHPMLQMLHQMRQEESVRIAPVRRIGTRMEPQRIIRTLLRGDVGCRTNGLNGG